MCPIWPWGPFLAVGLFILAVFGVFRLARYLRERDAKEAYTAYDADQDITDNDIKGP